MSAQHPTNYSAPLTQAGVEQRIVGISDAMEAATYELARYSDEAAEAEVTFKVKWARELLQAGIEAEGKITVGEKEATATLATEQELRRRLITEAHKEVAQETLRTMRARLDALRTVSANIRAQT